MLVIVRAAARHFALLRCAVSAATATAQTAGAAAARGDREDDRPRGRRTASSSISGSWRASTSTCAPGTRCLAWRESSTWSMNRKSQTISASNTIPSCNGIAFTLVASMRRHVPWNSFGASRSVPGFGSNSEMRAERCEPVDFQRPGATTERRPTSQRPAGEELCRAGDCTCMN